MTTTMIDTIKNLMTRSSDASIIAHDLLCDETLPLDELIADYDMNIPMNDAIELRDAIALALHSDSPFTRTSLSIMMIDFSICPMHRIDYHFCFLDNDAECAAIRNCFPAHDS